MDIHLHTPRPAEAQLSLPQALNDDIVVKPKFYKKTGWMPVLYLTAESKGQGPTRYVLSMNAGTGTMKLEKLVEVVPACDDPNTTVKDEDEDLRGPQS